MLKFMILKNILLGLLLKDDREPSTYFKNIKKKKQSRLLCYQLYTPGDQICKWTIEEL